jgi:hypothetical protein
MYKPYKTLEFWWYYVGGVNIPPYREPYSSPTAIDCSEKYFTFLSTRVGERSIINNIPLLTIFH